MSILQRQFRICLAAFLVVGLLLVGIASVQAAAAPCTDRSHHGMAALAGELEPAQSSAIDLFFGPGDNADLCCSVLATTCCANAAIVDGDAIAPRWSPLGPAAWIATATSILHGLHDKVSIRPPRVA